VIDCCATDGRASSYNAVHARRKSAALRDTARCDACVDAAFAAELAPYLEECPLQGHTVLVGALAHLRVSSASVERQHLIGEELKPRRSRGLVVDAQRLGEMSYAASVTRDAQAEGRAVYSRIGMRHGLDTKKLHALSKSFRLGSARYNGEAQDRQGKLQ
jgi:hypothetical protein